MSEEPGKGVGAVSDYEHTASFQSFEAGGHIHDRFESRTNDHRSVGPGEFIQVGGDVERGRSVAVYSAQAAGRHDHGYEAKPTCEPERGRDSRRRAGALREGHRQIAAVRLGQIEARPGAGFFGLHARRASLVVRRRGGNLVELGVGQTDPDHAIDNGDGRRHGARVAHRSLRGPGGLDVLWPGKPLGDDSRFERHHGFARRECLRYLRCQHDKSVIHERAP